MLSRTMLYPKLSGEASHYSASWIARYVGSHWIVWQCRYLCQVSGAPEGQRSAPAEEIPGQYQAWKCIWSLANVLFLLVFNKCIFFVNTAATFYQLSVLHVIFITGQWSFVKGTLHLSGSLLNTSSSTLSLNPSRKLYLRLLFMYK